MFNVPNEGRVTDRNTTLSLLSTADPVTPQNLPFDPVTGSILPSRALPKNAGFGAATNFQAPRTVQLQLRFSF